MENLKQTIAENISELRQFHGLTQAALAEQLNYSDKAVSKWERGESLPDIIVLKNIADIFSVSLDYLAEKEHSSSSLLKPVPDRHTVHNRRFITGMSILVVWLIATLIFIIIQTVSRNLIYHFLPFLYAVPCSFTVWLIFNAVWFDRRRNFLIVSLLMWSVLLVFYLTLRLLGYHILTLFILGIPGQIIILMWSRLRFAPSLPSRHYE